MASINHPLRLVHAHHPDRRAALAHLAAAMLLPVAATPAHAQTISPANLASWPLNTPRATGIHDLAPAPDGGVWFTAQRSGHLGYFAPKSGQTELIALGARSSPHGVIAGPDQAAWITDSGMQAIVRVGWPERSVRVFALPEGRRMPTSTPPPSMAMAICGSPARAASPASWRSKAVR